MARWMQPCDLSRRLPSWNAMPPLKNTELFIGALLKMLMPLAERGINLSKIESRPSKKRPWDYYFFLDVTGHFDDANMKAALVELKKFCPLVKWLGSYPAVDAGL